MTKISKLVWAIGFAASFASAAGSAVQDIAIAENDFLKDTYGDVTVSQVDKMNAENVRPLLKELVESDYFRYYKVDLSEDMCPFSSDELGMCGNRACAVEVMDDESEIPEFWRSQYLGRLAEDSVTTERMWSIDDDAVASSSSRATALAGRLKQRPIKSRDLFLDSELEDINYCYPEDESKMAPGSYVSLPDNPERYTGYGGPHAHKVWRAVYQENCFGYNGEMSETTSLMKHADGLPFAGSQLSSVLMDTNRHERQEIGGEAGRLALNAENQCVEQRLFYRILSGMHASVSSHLCYEFLNQSSGEWTPNLSCFMKRVGEFPERLDNLYFNYALVSRAVFKLREYVDDLVFSHEDESIDQNTRRQLLRLVKSTVPPPNQVLFNETVIFSSPEGQALKSEFRKRVRNVSGLMSCVGCDRCRLWGKLQTAGYGTALKLLFELPERPADDPEKSAEVMASFRRSELVALVNTFDRLSKSLEAIGHFRELLAEQPKEEPPLSAWDEELGAVMDAIKFVLQSYIDLPKNVYYLFLHYASLYWNRLVGRDLANSYSQVHIDL